MTDEPQKTVICGRGVRFQSVGDVQGQGNADTLAGAALLHQACDRRLDGGRKDKGTRIRLRERLFSIRLATAGSMADQSGQSLVSLMIASHSSIGRASGRERV